jgi:site-specific DNA-methyltransferase (adenine-specific)
MKRMEDNFIDLTVTSPPYDNLRDYKGYSFPFEDIAKGLYRVTKEGGVVVWVVGDATIEGSETGTSFRQALYFMECGFNLHDTMIWFKPNCFNLGSNNCYVQSFEYMFIISKGIPKSQNFIYDKENNSKGHVFRQFMKDKEGKAIQMNSSSEIKPMGKRRNTWFINVGEKEGDHPAVFPSELAQDHIKSWSNEGDLIYDPFMGSGTTAKMAHLLKRNWLGSEMSQEYVDLANKRLWPYISQKTLF